MISFGSREGSGAVNVSTAVEFVASDFARRFKGGSAGLVARGSSADFNSWVTVNLQVPRSTNADACVEWFVAQLARLGITLITDLHRERPVITKPVPTKSHS
jgi:hypothetical protein